MTKPQKKCSIDLNIKAVTINNLKDNLKVQILWKRGK
jgi:archaellum component FlaC